MSTRLLKPTSALIAIACVLTQCVPIDVADGDSSSSDALGVTDGRPFEIPADGGPIDDAAGFQYPATAFDSCTYDDQGGTCSWFGGELVLSFVAGALGGPQTITVTREVVRIGGTDLIGYVWGPHGHPIDPAAEVTVTVPFDYLPGAPSALATWDESNPPAELSGGSVGASMERYVLTGDLRVLNTLVIMLAQ